MTKHKYRTQREYRAQKKQHFEERRRALRKGLEREFAGMGVAVKDLSKFDRQMLYEYLLVKDSRGLKIGWLEMDFHCCGMGIFDLSVDSAKKKMGLTDAGKPVYGEAIILDNNINVQ